MTTVDARGYSCPQPVLMTKKALDGAGAPVTVLVDDKIPFENITRFAVNSGYTVSSKSTDDGEFEILIEK